MSESLLEKAKTWRELVLLAELGGWLHDLGKLSSEFVLSKTDVAYSTSGETGAPSQAQEEAETSVAGEPCRQKEKGWKHGEVFDHDADHILSDLDSLLNVANVHSKRN